MIRRLSILCAVVVAPAGCNVFDARSDGFECTTSDACDVPRTCQGGFCVLGGSTPDADVNVADADPNAADADPNAPDALPGNIVFFDDFEDGLATPLWIATEDPGTTVAETGGLLVLTPAANANVSRNASYSTVSRHQITERAFSIEIPLMVDTSTLARVELRIGGAGNNRASFVQQTGLLSFISRNDGGEVIEGTVTYDPVAHRFWRLRETGGTTFWETAPDGTTWAVQASAASPSSLSSANIDITAGTSVTVAAPGVANFDNATLELL